MKLLKSILAGFFTGVGLGAASGNVLVAIFGLIYGVVIGGALGLILSPLLYVNLEESSLFRATFVAGVKSVAPGIVATLSLLFFRRLDFWLLVGLSAFFSLAIFVFQLNRQRKIESSQSRQVFDFAFILGVASWPIAVLAPISALPRFIPN